MRQLKEILVCTDAPIVMAQEPRLDASEVDDFAGWCFSRQWLVAAEPSTRPRKGLSGGVLVLVRMPLGIRCAKSWRTSPSTICQAAAGRLLQGLVDVPNWSQPIGVASVYLAVGERLSERNTEILEQLLCLQSELRPPWRLWVESSTTRLMTCKVA